jgi:hypothetical protein
MTSVHDPSFDVPARPFFGYGAGPFRMRGVVYRDTVAAAERQLGMRGLTVVELLRRHGDARLETFMTQRFSPANWYDIAPAVDFAPLQARAVGITMAQHMRAAAFMHAEWAKGGFTSVVLRLLSTETVASWLPRISAWYHDFGRIETQVAGDRHVRGVRYGLPVFVVQSWAIIGMHFTEHVLAHSGAKDPRAHALEAEPDGEREGCPLYRVSFDITWG